MMSIIIGIIGLSAVSNGTVDPIYQTCIETRRELTPITWTGPERFAERVMEKCTDQMSSTNWNPIKNIVVPNDDILAQIRSQLIAHFNDRSDPDEAKAALHKWRSCLDVTTQELTKSAEPAEIVVKAARARCRGEEYEAQSRHVDSTAASGKYQQLSRSDLRTIFNEKAAGIADELLYDVMRARR